MLTAPPGSLDLANSNTVSPREDISPNDMKIVEESQKKVRGRKLGGLQRVNSFGNPRDNCSYTQFAIMDDDNLSGVQTKGGTQFDGSQWKSQFDDSEETTDNEWKQEKIQYVNPHQVQQQYIIPAPIVKYQTPINPEEFKPIVPPTPELVENKQLLQVSDIMRKDVISPVNSGSQKRKK